MAKKKKSKVKKNKNTEIAIDNDQLGENASESFDSSQYIEAGKKRRK